MTEHQASNASDKSLSDRLFPFAFFGALAVAILVAWNQAQPVEGQLVLTDTACHVIQYHGGKVERIAGENLCVVRATFRVPEHREMSWVRVDTARGAVEIRLAVKEIVSIARY